MENISKALMITGGILLALLISSLLIYVFRQVGEGESARDQIEEAKELKEFNQKYEAFNKTAMYGSDVASVINMAIDNNDRLADNYDKTYNEIDIELELNKSIEARRITKEWSDDARDYVETGKEKTDTVLRSGNNKLSENRSGFETLCTIEPIVIKQSKSSVTIQESVYSDFEKKIFKCTRVEYNGETGRVNKLCFSETLIAQNDYY